MNENQRQRIIELADTIRTHFDTIEQSVPPDSFCVGGAVRDTLCGFEPNDFDFVVVGETPASMQERGFEPIDASSFPVFHDSDRQEWALARKEQNTGTGYTDFHVETTDVSLVEDLSRRDLTVNAIALDPTSTETDGDWLCDPHNGQADIEDGVLRHVSESFAEDPLRILRVARYAGRFESFSVAPETKNLCRQISHQLLSLSRDRIGTELNRALKQASRPSRVLDVLHDTGALAVLWPDMARARHVRAGPEKHHAEGTVFEHTKLVCDRMHSLCVENNITGQDKLRRLWMAIAHDIGKIVCADNAGGINSDDPPIRFGGHAEIGADTIPAVARKLGLGAELQAVMEDACRLHMSFHDIPQMEPNELIDFVSDLLRNDAERTLQTNDAGEPHSLFGATVMELLDLAHADHEGRRVIEQYSTGEAIVQPSFDRDPFERRLTTVARSFNEIDGHEALETGLCAEHATSDIDRTHGIHCDEEKPVQSVMNRCESCRTAGDWVGKKLDSMRMEFIRDELY
jgi:tRNA nucleotidyltransferase (CCA-adding enzyme)